MTAFKKGLIVEGDPTYEMFDKRLIRKITGNMMRFDVKTTVQ